MFGCDDDDDVYYDADDKDNVDYDADDDDDLVCCLSIAAIRPAQSDQRLSGERDEKIKVLATTMMMLMKFVMMMMRMKRRMMTMVKKIG